MKRIISAVLSFFILASVLSVGAFAANDAQEMQSVLNQVKGKIPIPAEYSEFDYSKADEHWYFTWRNEGKGEIAIVSDNEGRIFAYEKSTNREEKANYAPKLLKTEAISKANAFLKQALSEAYAQLDFENVDVTTYGQGYLLRISRMINGHPCIDHSVLLIVDYQTGEVTKLSASWDYLLPFPKVAEPISSARAREIWQENTTMDLFYRIKKTVQDDGTVQNRAYLVYTPEQETSPINAENGKVIAKLVRWEENSNSSAGGMAESAQDKYLGTEYLTEKEIKKSEEYAGLISLEEAKKIAAQYPELSLSSDFAFAEGTLYKNYLSGIAKADDGSEYEWRLRYRGKVTEDSYSSPAIYVVINAKAGNIVSYYDSRFSDWRTKHTDKAVVTSDQAKAIAQDFLKKVQSACFAETQFSKDGSSQYLLDDGAPYGEDFSFPRVHENIRVENEGFRVCVDYNTGKIVSMNYSWTDSVQFDAAADKISAEAARDAYLNGAEPELCYQIATTYYYDVPKSSTASADIPIEPDAPKSLEAILTYRFVAPSMYIAAKDGSLVDYSGDAVQKARVFNGYQDIKNIANTREVELLADVGVLPQEENFRPREKVTQKEFIGFLMSARDIDWGGYYWHDSAQESDDYNYELAKRYGIIKDDEIAPDRTLSRYDAVLFCVRAAGYGRLCEDASIFKVNYSDAASIPAKYLGAAAIAKTTKIYVPGGASFSGGEILSRLDAARLIYGFLTREKK